MRPNWTATFVSLLLLTAMRVSAQPAPNLTQNSGTAFDAQKELDALSKAEKAASAAREEISNWKTQGDTAFSKKDYSAANKYYAQIAEKLTAMDQAAKKPPGYNLGMQAMVQYIQSLRLSNMTKEADIERLKQRARYTSVNPGRIRTLPDKAGGPDQYLELAEQCASDGLIPTARTYALLARDDAKSSSEQKKQATAFLNARLPKMEIPLDIGMVCARIEPLFKLKDYEEVKSQLEQSLKLYPDFEWPYQLMAHAALLGGKLDEAKTYAKKSVELNPNFARGYAEIALIEQAENNVQKRDEAFKSATTLLPSDNYVMWALWQCHLAQSK